MKKTAAIISIILLSAMLMVLMTGCSSRPRTLVLHFDEETTTLSWDAAEFRDSIISYDIRLLAEGGGISGFVPAPLRPGEERIGAVFAGGFSYLNMIYTDFDISRIRAVHTHRVQIRVRAREER
ncbi:MAG: hypothetical protein FWC82_03045, partial [Firmicutes bacterium]|nr:hypothetical protein [Bacillota bacterium]